MSEVDFFGKLLCHNCQKKCDATITHLLFIARQVNWLSFYSLRFSKQVWQFWRTWQLSQDSKTLFI